MIEIFDHCALLVYMCGMWFFDMLDAMGLTGHYYAFVFVAMATGFLLKRFGSALSLGSDKAAQHFKRKGDE